MYLFHLFVFHLAVKLKLWGRASLEGELLLKGKPNLPAEYCRLAGYGHSRARRHARAEELLIQAITKEPQVVKHKIFYFKVLVRAGKKEQALNECHELLEKYPQSIPVLSELAQILKSQSKWLQLVSTLEYLSGLAPLVGTQRAALANAYERLERFDAARLAFSQHAENMRPNWKHRFSARVLILLPSLMKKYGGASVKKYGARIQRWVWTNNPALNQSDYWFRAGANAERGEELERAGQLYKKAVATSWDTEVKRLGVGVLHQRRGDWVLARRAYARTLDSGVGLGELHERIGICFERAFDWCEAASEYQKAIRIGPSGLRYRRLGFVYERLGPEYAPQAESAYLAALDYQDVSREGVLFNLGRQALAANKTDKACEYFSRMMSLPAQAELNGLPDEASLRAILERDVRDWRHWSQLGIRCFSLQRYDEAAEAFFQAVWRNNVHKPDSYFFLALSLYELGDLAGAAESFMQVRKISDAFSVTGARYRLSPAARGHGAYAHYYENLDLKDNWILYESYFGTGLSCNPYAIFLSVLKDQRFSEFNHVWVISELEKVPEEFRFSKNIFFVKKGSDTYLRYLCVCKYLVNNNTFPPYFIRKPGQRYLNTWHGTPLKTLGVDMKGSPVQRANTARNFIQASHLISPNRHTSRVLVDGYDICGSVTAKVLETGYPRIDLMLNNPPESKETLLRALGLKRSKPVVLYAPTYRGLWDSPAVETERLVADVKALISDEYQLVFRGHHATERVLSELELPVVIAPSSIDSCMMLSVTDVLITDYSSIFYDFLPTQRPIIHYIYDFDDYSRERGMYFGKEGLPGVLCYDVEAVKREVVRWNNENLEPNPHYLSLSRDMCGYEDGASTDRAVDFFFFDKYDESRLYQGSSKRSLLFYGSTFDDNGITSSCRDLLNSIDKSRFSVTVMIDRLAIISDDARYAKMASIESIEVVIRTGAMSNTFEEEWVIQRYPQVCDDVNEEFLGVYSSAYAREFRRLFSEKKFDAVIDFNGYPTFWGSLFALSGQAMKAIYMHSNMWNEYCTKLPSLRALFNIYKNFDVLISVSESVSQENLTQLAERFDIPAEKFRFVNNKIDSARIRALAEEGLDDPVLERMGRGQEYSFISVGRLSPEKRPDRLIRAFHILSSRPDESLTLYIVGEGVLKPDLVKLVGELGLSDRVHFLGYKRNPFPYIRMADCLVLSSDHEGQGLVLLEAMVLGVPCVSTDTPGPRSVLANGGGVLVELSPEGMCHGMQAVMDGEFTQSTFDAVAYETAAMSSFYAAMDLDHHVH